MNRLSILHDMRRGSEQWQFHWDKRRFASGRADYYDYLSALIKGMQGRRTLKDIFQADASRYGANSVRGRLSAHWAQAYQATGGDLYATWLGCFPLNELGLIRAAQSCGNAALIGTLADLAQVLELVRQAADILFSTLWAAALAVGVLLVMVLAVPFFTVPSLLHTFSAVPPQMYGRLTRLLIDLSHLVHSHFLFVLVLLAGGAALLAWSLPNLTGPARRHLEKFALWRGYRCIGALRFLALLTLVLDGQGTASTQLRSALAMQKTGASKWQCWHIQAMLDHIDMGRVGADTFDTGLLDQDLYWFMGDMMAARGLADGLRLTRQRLKKRVLVTVARQALVLRWCSLLFCVACLLGLGLWHYAVIDELRRSLMLFYASH